MHLVRSLARLGALATALLVGSAAAAQGQGTTITGKVTEQGTGQPVPEVQVFIVGTTLGGLTNAQGQYTIRGAPAGPQTLRAIRIGYGEEKRAVTVTAGQTVTQDITLGRSVVELQPVVTTATGEQRRVEIGNAVSNINAAKVTEVAPVSNLADLLNSRAPGVSVISGTQTGTGQRVRIRGANSLSLGNDPIYVIDGVRMTSNNSSISFGTGGNNPSRVTDINPEEIENIEIVKGPSAATLYGTDAANGVIVITTKRGRAGAPRWNVYGEGGMIKDLNDYATNYTLAGHSPTGSALITTGLCTLSRVAAGTCIPDSLRTYSPINDPDATPLGTGYRNQVGLQVSGGSESVRYFVSGEREDETGLLKLPEFERRRMDSTGTVIRPWTERPNALLKHSFRTNLNTALTPKLDVALNAGFINVNSRYSLESNATAGLGSHVFGGPGYRNNGFVATTGTVQAQATPLNGYRAWTPGYTWQEKTGQRVNRFMPSANINYRPAAWLSARANVGTDITSRVDDNLLFRGEGPPITSTYREGFKGNARTTLRTFTTDASATGSFTPTTWLNSKTTIGTQYTNYQLDNNSAEADNLSPGTQTASGGSIPSASEATTLQKTLGLYIEEAVAIRDRLFLTAALRTDQNSAFGTNFQNVVYPKASLSWIVSDEGFFPQTNMLNSFRLRAAYGASGVQPGSNDALRTYSSSGPNVRGTDQPAVLFSDIGNDDLKPERTTEIEAGFEVKLFDNRASLDLTYYAKRTKDALISAIVPPSLGAAGNVRRNLGAVQNRGWELLLNAQPISSRAFGLDFTLNGSINSNKLLSLGGTPEQIGTTTRAVENYPLFGLWARPILGWEDKDNNRIITYSADAAKNELFVGDSAIFRGYNQPRYMATLTTGIDLFSRRLRLQTLLDYRGGNLYYNNTERIRCASRQNCNGLNNPDASFEEQAMVVAHLVHPSATLDGFFQPGSFVKLREVSAQLTAPESWVSRLGRIRSLSLVGTARNIKHWSNYRGVDPETDFTASEGGNNPSDFQTVGPPSMFILRLNIGF